MKLLAAKVSTEEREMAHRIARERGTTVSRMIRDTVLLPYVRRGKAVADRRRPK